MEITLKLLRNLLKTLDAGSVTEFEYQDEKYRLRLCVARPGAGALASGGAQPADVRSQISGASLMPPAEDPTLAFVTSPFVGTFYRSSTPESEAFVEVGASIKQGQTLCIVEAMKLMNEIEAEFSCMIQEILVENGASVEFGQRLFKVKRA
jgi:acetyl-CoA carboxylase biotin carboxyl carrier protein